MSGKWKTGRCQCSNYMHQESLYEAYDEKADKPVYLCAKCMTKKYGKTWYNK